MNRYTHSFLISSFLYTVLILGFIYMASNAPRQLGDRVIKIAMLEPQEKQLEQKQKLMDTLPAQEKTEDKPKEEIVKKIETTKPNISKNIAAKQPEVAKQKDEQGEAKQQQMAQEAIVNADAEKNQFLSHLKDEIKKNKHYPPAARRRGQEGTVKVSFLITPSGSVSNIVCVGEHSILNSAAREAVYKAFPVKVPQNVIKTAFLEVSLVLNFKLDSSQ
ncbi:MAG: energy transducer TonB [Sulfurovaceae bacterium]